MGFFYSDEFKQMRTRDEHERARRAEEEEEDFEQHHVVSLWRSIEQHRAAIFQLQGRLKWWLECNPALARHWQAFIDAGGVTADDYEKFCAGTMRHRSTPSRKHLRLIRSNRKNVVRRIRLRSDGNDAA